MRRERLAALSARHRRADGIRPDRHRHPNISSSHGVMAGFFCLRWSTSLGMIWLSIAPTRFAVIHSACRFPWFSRRRCGSRSLSACAGRFGRMVHIRYALDDWYFARDLHSSRAAGARERGSIVSARELVRIVRDTDADEIIVDGHSLGAPLSLVVLDRALQLDPQLRSRGKTLHRRVDRLVAAESRAASGRRLAARGRRPRGQCAGGLLGRISGAGRHHQCLQGRSGRGARSAADRQADR